MRFTIILILLVVSCGEKGRHQSSEIAYDTLTLDTLKSEVIAKKTSKAKGGLILSSDNVRIVGDTTIERDKIYVTSIKFEPYISFDDFQVDSVDRGKRKADLELSSNRGASRFKTTIRNQYNADTVNFAGHYTFAWWGTGSPGQNGVIVDRRTGKIYDAPSAALGYDFRPNSRMLIVNDPDPEGFYDDCFYCKPLIYVLDETTKEFIEKHPK